MLFTANLIVHIFDLVTWQAFLSMSSFTPWCASGPLLNYFLVLLHSSIDPSHLPLITPMVPFPSHIVLVPWMVLFSCNTGFLRTMHSPRDSFTFFPTIHLSTSFWMSSTLCSVVKYLTELPRNVLRNSTLFIYIS